MQAECVCVCDIKFLHNRWDRLCVICDWVKYHVFSLKSTINPHSQPCSSGHILPEESLTVLISSLTFPLYVQNNKCNSVHCRIKLRKEFFIFYHIITFDCFNMCPFQDQYKVTDSECTLPAWVPRQISVKSLHRAGVEEETYFKLPSCITHMLQKSCCWCYNLLLNHIKILQDLIMSVWNKLLRIKGLLWKIYSENVYFIVTLIMSFESASNYSVWRNSTVTHFTVIIVRVSFIFFFLCVSRRGWGGMVTCPRPADRCQPCDQRRSCRVPSATCSASMA